MHAPLALEARAGSVVRQNEPLLVAAHVSKSFRGVAAVRDVTFELRVGEVHGLVGANGAGKSTFIRLLAGAERADSISLSLSGYDIEIANPRHARIAGIAAIYQELSLVPEMTAASNVFLGRAPRRGPLLRKGAMRARYREIAEWMGVGVPPHAKVSKLSVSDQQMIEIMRAVEAQNKVLILDEPTAPLGPHERSKLYQLIERVKRSGTGIVFISHDLDEVLAICDRVSIMRDGQLIGTKPSHAWSKQTLVAAMLGDVQAGSSERPPIGLRPERLRAFGLRVPGRVHGVSFTLNRGEVLGIAGLVGSGRTELLRALAGSQPGATGNVHLDGHRMAMPSTVKNSITSGITLVPEDRKLQGLVLSRPALTNVTLPGLRRLSTLAFIQRRRQRREAKEIAASVGFSPKRLRSVAGTLSGGNQQKLVIGKWLAKKPGVLLLDEPTRGVDIGAKREIYETVRRIADAGTSVILVSSDLEEVVEQSDRILVMARGRGIATLMRSDASVERILNLIFGVSGGNGNGK